MGWITGPYTTEPGPRRTFGKLTCWAEDGYIYCQWDDGTKDVLELADARTRLTEIAGTLGTFERDKDNGGPGVDRAFAREMYYQLRGSLENLRDCIKDAEHQGDSTDPRIRYEKVKAFLRSKRTTLGYNHDLSRVKGAESLASALVFPVTYDTRLPEYVPPPKKGALLMDAPPLPPA